MENNYEEPTEEDCKIFIQNNKQIFEQFESKALDFLIRGPLKIRENPPDSKSEKIDLIFDCIPTYGIKQLKHLRFMILPKVNKYNKKRDVSQIDNFSLQNENKIQKVNSTIDEFSSFIENKKDEKYKIQKQEFEKQKIHRNEEKEKFHFHKREENEKFQTLILEENGKILQEIKNLNEFVLKDNVLNSRISNLEKNVDELNIKLDTILLLLQKKNE
jgi:hypothetical protein